MVADPGLKRGYQQIPLFSVRSLSFILRQTKNIRLPTVATVTVKSGLF